LKKKSVKARKKSTVGELPAERREDRLGRKKFPKASEGRCFGRNQSGLHGRTECNKLKDEESEKK